MHTAPWPTKRREFHNHHFDSTIWNDFNFRDDDIIIATYAKSGTTWMKQNASKSAPLGGVFWDGGAEVFINKGTNGRWRDSLTADEVREYEARAIAELGGECAVWLASGSGGV